MTSMGLNLGLGLSSVRNAGGGAPAPPASTITSLTIMPANGIQADLVDGADAADANGWVAKIVLPDDGVSTFDPTKVVLTVKDYGYDALGNLLSPGSGGPVRTITGRAIIRKQWANQTQRLNSASGGTRTIYVSLSDTIYASSVVTASASAGYYGAASAGTIANVTNRSTRAYPKPLFAWLNAQHDRATGANLYVEGYAAHRWGLNGRMVACVKYRANDSQGTPNLTPEVTVAVPTLSTLCTQGQPPEVYAANLAQANLTNGDLCFVNAKVYPWIGDASAVLDLTSDGVAVTGNWSQADTQTPLRFVCDRTGAYGGARAYVRPTGTLAGTNTAGVFTSDQAYGLTNAQCYASVDAAAQALASWSGTNKGHADVGGHTAYLTDDGAGGSTAFTSLAHSRAAGKCYLDIKRDPNAVGATTVTLSTTQSVSTLTRITHNVTHSALNGLDGGNTAGKIIAFENMTVDQTGSPATSLHYRNPLVTYRNVTVVNPRNDFWSVFNGSDSSRIGLLLGCVADTASGDVRIGSAHAVLGCRATHGVLNTDVTIDKGVWANNKMLKITNVNAAGVGGSTSVGSPVTGFAIVQNIWEGTRASNGAALWGVGFDNSLIALDNIVMVHNTIPGTDITNRYNGGYCDNQNTGTGGTAAGVIKRIHYRFNIFGHYNNKSDTFASGSQGGTATNTGRTNNWSIRYHVGDEGNIYVSSTQAGDTAVNTSGASWLGEQLNPSNATNVTAAFVSQQAGQGAAGGGDYHLSGASNAAYDRVAGAGTSGITLNGASVSRAALTFDIAGAARKTDGHGAAGAYERTDL